MPTLKPTDEQQAAIDVFATGDNLILEAGAGTGKTSTLKLLADATTDRGIYIAYNRAIADEAASKFPRNVSCRTAHSLAYRAVGHEYKDRLGGGFQPWWKVSKALGFDGPLHAGERVLSTVTLARLTMEMVANFCNSADLQLGIRHRPYVEGLVVGEGDEEQDFHPLLAEYLLPHALRAWDALQDPTDVDSPVKFSHDHYLKMWQLARPTIQAEFILFDECQLPTARVALAGGGEWNTKALGDIEVGDRVVSYTKGRIMSEKFGSVVEGRSVRHFEGDLVNISTVRATSAYTPNHICMARINNAFDGKHLVYLMRKGERWRVGVTKARHGTGPGRTTGVMGRLREEQGDAVWVLAAFDSREAALAEEQIVSLTYRLPQVRFEVEKFWSAWDVRYSDPKTCATAFGRDLKYPLIGTERQYMLGDRFTEIRAANLMDGMEVMHRDGTLEPITVWRTPYIGPVVSLTVSGPKTYVADDIVTHNCQDANPVIASVVEQNLDDCQVVAVGDRAQAIYGWRGAVDFMETGLPGAERRFLSQSWRFGQAIADNANLWLEQLDTPLRLTGTSNVDSRINDYIEQPRAILCRSNAGALQALLNAQAVDQKAHLVGGATDIGKFCDAVIDLQTKGKTFHRDLIAFESWAEVVEYVKESKQAAGDLGTWVSILEKHGVETVRHAIQTMTPEDNAEVTISTAHKAKGREWDTVRISDDFAAPVDKETGAAKPLSSADIMLRYVAVTRAKLELEPGVLRLGAPQIDRSAEFDAVFGLDGGDGGDM